MATRNYVCEECKHEWSFDLEADESGRATCDCPACGCADVLSKGFWVHVGSDELGGDLYGEYDSAAEASQAIARIALQAFELEDDCQRAYTIIEAEDKDEAKQEVYRRFGVMADD